MLKRSAALAALYVMGIVVVGGWALSHVLAGTVTTENAAAVIVWPLAWTFGFWPVVGPLVLVRKIWRLQTVVEDVCTRRAAGAPDGESMQELEDTLTLLAAEENHIPERLVRPFVRRFLQREGEPAA